MKVLLISLFLTVHIVSGQGSMKYNLKRPAIQRQLPPVLNEISGLTDIDASRIACVQDELGIVFIYNFKKDSIESYFPFDSTGDFEGLTMATNALYILRSDGRLTELDNYKEGGKEMQHDTLALQTSNNEGLCFDARYHRLLIAAKSKPIPPGNKSERFIYAYDLNTKQLSEKPLYSLNVEYLASIAPSFNIQQRDTNARGQIKAFNFRPSSLSVHPLTDDIYIISAADKLMIIMNREGQVVHMESLHPQLFAKAEGITFLSDGTMIITNEAAGKTPSLYVFNMQQ